MLKKLCISLIFSNFVVLKKIVTYHSLCKRLHEYVLHISKKPLRYELSGFPSICLAEASCIFQSACL